MWIFCRKPVHKKEGSYIRHKGNTSSAVTSTAAASVAESSLNSPAVGELSPTTQTAPESGVDYIPEYNH